MNISRGSVSLSKRGQSFLQRDAIRLLVSDLKSFRLSHVRQGERRPTANLTRDSSARLHDHQPAVFLDGRLLDSQNNLERLLQHPFLQCTEALGIDKIIWFNSLLYLLKLMPEPQGHQELKSLFKLMGVLAYRAVPAFQFHKPLCRRGVIHPHFQRAQSCGINDRAESIDLDVEFALMDAVLFAADVPKETKGRSVLHDVACHMGEEEVTVLDCMAQKRPKLFSEQNISVNGPEIEEYKGLKDRLGCGVVYPVQETCLPDAQWLAPFWIAGHIVCLTRRKAASYEGILHQGGKFREILSCIFGVFFRVFINDGVVLIRLEGLLFSPLTAVNDPAIAEGRGPQFGLRDLEDFFQKPVVYLGYDPGYIACFCPFLDE